MPARTYPSFLVFIDEKGEWRWRYDASATEPVVQSHRGFLTLEDCKRSIRVMGEYADKEIWYLEAPV
jgi:uncharacterized protein